MLKIEAALTRRSTRLELWVPNAPHGETRTFRRVGSQARYRYVTVSREPCSAERNIASQTSAAR